VFEVRRDDGELCGFVARHDDEWQSLTVFGAVLDEHPDERSARHHVVACGLAVLADRWTLVDAATGDEQVVCIQQASPAEITLALDFYSMPGVPTMTLRADDLASGRWHLSRG
jgi:hypothetical protein